MLVVDSRRDPDLPSRRNVRLRVLTSASNTAVSRRAARGILTPRRSRSQSKMTQSQTEGAVPATVLCRETSWEGL